MREWVMHDFEITSGMHRCKQYLYALQLLQRNRGTNEEALDNHLPKLVEGKRNL